MSNDKIIPFKDPAEKMEDALTIVLREGARDLLAKAVEAEVQVFLSQYDEHRDDQGRQQIVRNGYLPARTIQSGLGDIEVQVPRTRDRGGSGIQISSSLIPPYLKRTQSIEELLALPQIMWTPKYLSDPYLERNTSYPSVSRNRRLNGFVRETYLIP